jgi:hypothetical protein
MGTQLAAQAKGSFKGWHLQRFRVCWIKLANERYKYFSDRHS